MRKHKTKLITTSLLLFVSITMVTIYSLPIALGDPFGIFNYDHPVMVKIQGLRAHLFETHDATHNANSSEVMMHLDMANEEITHFLQNVSSGKISINQIDGLPDLLKNVQMQLNNASTIISTGNMTSLMSELKQADQQLAGSLNELGYKEVTNTA